MYFARFPQLLPSRNSRGVSSQVMHNQSENTQKFGMRDPSSDEEVLRLRFAQKGRKTVKRKRIVSENDDKTNSLRRTTQPSRIQPKVERETVSVDLDSFLNDLPEDNSIVRSTESEVVSTSSTETHSSSSKSHFSEPSVNDRGRSANKKASKLERVRAEFQTFLFEKIVSHVTCSSPFDENLYRNERGINIDLTNVEDNKDLMPIRTWHAAGLPLPVMRVIESRSFMEPTPIQAQSLPIIMRGYDLLGVAPTGSGKTVAFSIPLCRHVATNMINYQNAGVKGPFALVVVPTRELCIQIQRELTPWAASLHLETLSCYGGSDITSQISALVNHRSDIIIATPGRLIDLLAANNGRVLSLNSVTFLVVDETDRMFDLGFGPQVRKIVECIRPDRQTVVFSATLPKPLEGLILRILRNPIKVLVAREPQKTDSHEAYSIPAEVTQDAILLPDDKSKYATLLRLLLKSAERAASLVFVNTQTLADSLALKMNAQGLSCRALHGGMDQRDRDDVISDFTTGRLPILVATSVAARGLDVKNLKLVINYDAASHVEDYIHRAGRTGRAGERGSCVSLLLPAQRKEAFYLSALFPLNEELRLLAAKYEETHRKDEDTKIPKFPGFGGHGLAMLDHKRELKTTVERGAHDDMVVLPLLESDNSEPVIKEMGQNSFCARFLVNELPKEVRIAVTSSAKQSEVSQNYHVSLTLKGTFSAAPRQKADVDSKLHVLIEGHKREEVANAFTSLQSYANEKLTGGRQSQGKYSSF